MGTTIAAFTGLDWGVLVAYLLLMLAMGAALSRGQRDEVTYFLGGRAVPVWAVALSVLATALSAATFIGVPELGYGGDLTYLALNLGGILGALVVAFFFIPPLYRAGTVTIYGYLGRRFGTTGMVASSGAFLLGRLLASGARLYIAGIAFSLILYGDIRAGSLAAAIVIFGAVGTLYVALGGIKAVIYTDVVQIVVVVGAALLSIYLLLDAIPLEFSALLDQLRHFPVAGTGGGEGGGAPGTVDKLRVFDFSADLGQAYTVWAAVAFLFLNVASFGVDQDLVQRMMTTRSAWKGSASLIGAILLYIPVIALFLFIGLLLAVYYGLPEVMGEAYAGPLDDSRKVYPQFLLDRLPAGLSGLALAGMFAAAMSSFDSAVNAMASSAVADLYAPWRAAKGRPLEGDAAKLAASRRAVVACGVLLTAFALVAAAVQEGGKSTLVDFALGVMSFAYAGLLGVFITALFTGRGNGASVVAALLVGALVVLLLQPFALPAWFGFKLAWPYWMCIATPISTAVCALGRPAVPGTVADNGGGGEAAA